ncbi:hypothetical protein [Mangrovicoccus sp. HB161399]|uniref:hypothetical protein n=1 Tax=Mangrovicoccus sp. HB161399 TaxID=2720392 RepID=UPI001555C358|nr:hypothetical protein [Mangrovicoccus sp. HB161399]
MIAIPASDRAFALRRSRLIMNGSHPVEVRDQAIKVLWDYDPRYVKNTYAEHLTLACDARAPALVRASAIDWLIAHTASTDQLGQRRLDLIRAGLLTVGEPE